MSPGQSPKSFMPVLTIPASNWTCAVDDPSKVVSLTGVGGFPDVAQCAMQCTGDADCSGFNLKINASLCEMYLYNPTRFALVPDCQYRQVTINLKDQLLKLGNSRSVDLFSIWRTVL